MVIEAMVVRRWRKNKAYIWVAGGLVGRLGSGFDREWQGANRVSGSGGLQGARFVVYGGDHGVELVADDVASCVYLACPGHQGGDPTDRL